MTRGLAHTRSTILSNRRISFSIPLADGGIELKQYMDPSGFRLVGKAWEVRHQLRKLSSKKADGRKPLAEYVRAGAPK